MSSWVGDHDYCRKCTKQSQLQYRLGISIPERLCGKKSVSSNFQQNMPTIGEETRNRPSYYSWNLDPNCLCTDSLQQKWSRRDLHAFPTFALIQKVLKKVEEEKLSSVVIVTPTWQTRSWSSELLRLSLRKPIILPVNEDLIKGPQNQ